MWPLFGTCWNKHIYFLFVSAISTKLCRCVARTSVECARIPKPVGCFNTRSVDFHLDACQKQSCIFRRYLYIHLTWWFQSLLSGCTSAESSSRYLGKNWTHATATWLGGFRVSSEVELDVPFVFQYFPMIGRFGLTIFDGTLTGHLHVYHVSLGIPWFSLSQSSTVMALSHPFTRCTYS